MAKIKVITWGNPDSRSTNPKLQYGVSVDGAHVVRRIRRGKETGRLTPMLFASKDKAENQAKRIQERLRAEAV